MKKHLAILSTLMLCMACNDSSPLPEPENHPDVAVLTANASQPILRTPEMAVDVATRAISLLRDVTPVSRSGISRRIDPSAALGIVSSPTKSRSGIGGRDTLMYVVNYADSMGFALVSAVPNTPELIAVTIRGSYNPDEPCDNPGFNMYMENAVQYLENESRKPDNAPASGGNHFIDDPRIPMPLEKIETDTIWIKKVPNRVKVFWGQNIPEGDSCSNYTSGCSNTAVAMMMTFFKKPSSLTLKYTPAKETIQLNWDELSKHKSFGSFSSNGLFYFENCGQSNYPIHSRLAQLCRELGFRSNSTYHSPETDGKTGTSTTTANTMATLRGMGYQFVQNMKCEFRTIEKDLDSNSILLMHGVSTITPDIVGHMWVCDAVKSFYCKYRRYQADPRFILDENTIPDWKLVETWRDDNDTVLYFYNWGWGSPDGCGFFRDLNFEVKGWNFNNDVGYIKVTSLPL